MSAAPAAPFLVHLPASYRKLEQLISHLERNKPGAVPRYAPLCGCAKKVELPPNVRVARTSEGRRYLVAGPHERYYEKCSACDDLEEEPL